MKVHENPNTRAARMLRFALLGLVIALLAAQPATALSQTEPQEWTPPINVSRTGGASDPAMVVDAQGVKHVIWLDSYEGYMYSRGDAEGWSEPEAVVFPFTPSQPASSEAAPLFPIPELVADSNGRIHAFWIDDRGVLFHSSASAGGVGYQNGWLVKQALTDSAIDFDVTKDANGAVHVAYIHNIDSYNAPAGVYYRSLVRSYVWTNPVSLAETPYFRSISAENANVSIATSVVESALNVFVAWDNQPRNRISVIKSADAGVTWGEPHIVDGPEVSSGPVQPRNIKVGAYGSSAVLVWQVVQPGDNCTQNYQYSSDAGETWHGKQRMLTGIQGCADENQFFTRSDGLMLLMTKILGQVYLHAWDGSRWSDPQFQEALTSFIDEETFNLVSLSCQYATMTADDTLNVVGCDTGTGGDIWLASRQTGAVESWFTTPSVWSLPATVATNPGASFSNSLAADEEGNVHLLWSQAGEGANGVEGGTLQYSRWDGVNWSAPMTVFGAPVTSVNAPSVTADGGRLYAVFADQATGEINFTSVDITQTTNVKAWIPPELLPVPRNAAASPQIHITEDGTLHVAYAVPINELRGIYMVSSTDGGETWSSPRVVFDAVGANWPVVDAPQLAFTAPDHLYLIFTQYALPGRNRPIGLYSTRSEDGGATWAAPQPVTEEPTSWSDIRSAGEGAIHIAWQELSNGSYTVWHNLSTDNGQTWTGRNSLHDSTEAAVLSPMIVDEAGRIHLLQSSKEEPASVTFTHWIWEAPQWSISDVSKFGANSTDNVNALLGTGTPDGGMVVVYSIELQAPGGEGETTNTIFSTQRGGEAGEAAGPVEPQAEAVEEQTAEPTGQAAEPILSPTAAMDQAQPTPPSLMVEPVTGSVPVSAAEPVVKQNKWIGLILGVGVAVIVVAIIFIFGSSSVRKRGLK